ncbi:MAG TPA: T9SS type A sorting domain-containing protein [Bacteroidia bacterium]|nr:T9SS type A sorting domain-containing protein [Bacteroidia bacterium]
MKKLLLFFSIMVKIEPSDAQFILPQLQAGVYVDTAFGYFFYGFPGYCDSLGVYDVIFSVDPGLIPLVSGTQIQGTVISVSPADSVSSIQAGIIHVGDTLQFPSSTSNYYTISSTAAGGIGVELRIVGTPSVPFENYPCELSIICTLADCGNTCLLLDQPPACSVNDFTGINEALSEFIFNIKPNPATDKFELYSAAYFKHESLFEISNLEGQIILKETLSMNFKSKNFSTDQLPNGIYFWKTISGGKENGNGKIVVIK